MLPKFDALVQRLLKEYSDDTIVVRGEYWFDERGKAMYADGKDAMDHQTYVIQRCAETVANYFGLDEFNENSMIDRITDKVGNSWGDIENDPASAIIKYLVTFFKMDEEKADDLVLTAYGSHGDAREYAIKNWNWIRVHGPNIEVNKLNTQTLKKVAEGIRDALEQEGEMYEDDSYERADRGVYNISTYTGKRYTITLDDMERGNVSGLETAMTDKSAAGQQLRQQDVNSMPSFYQKKGVIGDSVIWKK
jgi:hypothetical protein